MEIFCQSNKFGEKVNSGWWDDSEHGKPCYKFNNDSNESK